jgi:AcrR family transcriptional regulator
MPRTAKDNELIRATRREEIFLAAGRVFAKKGFAATKIADIAAEAGLSHGLLYHYFTSKEAVYAALFDEIMKRRPLREEVTKGSRSAIERVERIVAMWLEKTKERPELSILIAQAFLGDTFPSAQRDAFLEYSRESFQHMLGDIAQAQRDGDVTRRVPVEELALTLLATVRGLAVIRVAFASVGPQQPMPCVETLMRGLRPSADETTLRPAGRSSSRANGRPGRPPAPKGKSKSKETTRAARA